MPVDVFLALLGFAIVSSVTPGPNNLMLLSSGVTFGFRRTIPHMLGIGVGFVILLLAVGAGLGALLTALPWLHTALKIAGGVYLLYLAWHIAMADTIEAEGTDGAQPMRFIGAAAFQWVNPKAWLMAVSAMATYTIPGNYLWTMLLVAFAFGLVNLPCVSLWAGLGSALRPLLSSPRLVRGFNIAMALLLVVSLWPMLK